MFTINIIKADFEGWWLFDDWQEHIIVTYEFETSSEMLAFYERLITQMRHHFASFNVGKNNMIAFFNCCDVRYCDDCDEDLQMYISPIMMDRDATITDESYYKTKQLINF